MHKHKTPIIVGFDPGLTAGLAILDLNGNLVYLNSFKEIAKSEIITTIMKHGKAILIATDVWNPPKSVKKLASSLNAKIFSPKSNLSVSYKTEIVNDFLKNINDFSIDFSGSNIHPNNYTHGSVDAHERDSLSAAILAFNNYKNKLTQLERKFLEAKMSLNSIDKESIINENYYEILNQSKSFLINDRSISDSINMAFESYNLIENEDSNAQVPDVAKINISGDNVTNTTTTTTTTNINNNNNNNNNIGNNTCIIDSNNYNNKDYNNNNNIDIINNNIGYSNVDYNNIDSNVDSHIDSNDIENIGDIREDYNILGEKVDKLKKINKSQEKQIKNQDKLLEKLKNKNELLANELTEKNEKILKIEKELKESKFKESKAILKDKEVASKIKLLKTIQFKYKEEKELRKSLEEKLNKRLKLDDFNELSIFTPIKIINSFTKNGIKEADNLFKLKRGDVIYLASSEGGGSQTAKFIVDLGIKAIVANKNNESIPPQAEEVFENEEIPIINENQLDIKFFDDYAVADSKILEEKINNWKTQSKEKTTKKAQEDLLNVINEYRVERKRDV